MLSSKVLASRNASGREGANLPRSVEMMVCLRTPTCSARAAWGMPACAQSSVRLGLPGLCALRHYRAAYAEVGAEQSSLFDGIDGLLDRLGSVQCPMAVATSKMEDQAVWLVRAFGIDRHFADICGASDAAGRPPRRMSLPNRWRGSRRRVWAFPDRSWWVTGATTLPGRPRGGRRREHPPSSTGF
jgi:hypothetical protein